MSLESETQNYGVFARILQTADQEVRLHSPQQGSGVFRECVLLS